ncbi:LPS translocon maturation chaperone LptM [Allopusillimonas ginsengisoli]|uniref:LPS translocon maturation chaperone LptM n=1 Tax=Allopusillimonas ginsengisoli TaxID=453575 RepID=UPI0010C177AA|nr:hypothetical protein D7I39_15610 [Allopusillimonas ginsengisoli]
MQVSPARANVHAVTRLAASVTLLALLAACGYKGPLYLPPPAAPDRSLTAPPTDSPPGPVMPQRGEPTSASPR